MLNFGNREFRNLQEQVLKNARDISDLYQGDTVLNQFGIEVIGQTATPPVSVEGYTDADIGKAYAVGTETPYELYILTRPFNQGDPLQWFNIGPFPAPGPTGATGPAGPDGATPEVSATATASTLDPGQSANVSVSKTGTTEAPVFNFNFQIPKGEKRRYWRAWTNPD